MALTLDMLKEAVGRDPDYQDLIDKIRAGQKPDTASTLHQYRNVWQELSVLDGLVMRGDKIVIPQADLGNEVGNLRQWVVELAHEGHMGGPAAKRTLRKRLSLNGQLGGGQNQHLRTLSNPPHPSTPSRQLPPNPSSRWRLNTGAPNLTASTYWW